MSTECKRQVSAEFWRDVSNSRLIERRTFAHTLSQAAEIWQHVSSECLILAVRLHDADRSFLYRDFHVDTVVDPEAAR